MELIMQLFNEIIKRIDVDCAVATNAILSSAYALRKLKDFYMDSVSVLKSI